MTTDADRVAAKVAAMFTGDEAARVGTLLGAYDDAGSVGADRVRLAVLKLSGGDAERIPELLALARIDPRDVVGEAEFTRQMHHAPGMATADEVEADRRDYDAWLAG